MADDLRVTVTGATEVAAALRRVAGDVTDLPALDQVADQGAEAIRANAPHLAGDLAASVGIERSAGRAAVVATTVYAGPINYGWPARGIAATGFMQSADERTPITVRLLENDLNQTIQRRGLSR